MLILLYLGPAVLVSLAFLVAGWEAAERPLIYNVMMDNGRMVGILDDNGHPLTDPYCRGRIRGFLQNMVPPREQSMVVALYRRSGKLEVQ